MAKGEPRLRGAAAVDAIGGSSLCLSLRGSDRRGEDFYNIAQTVDLHAALASPALADYERIYLCLAADEDDLRQHAQRVACPPPVHALRRSPGNGCAARASNAPSW